jgi:hypothetical protein
MHAVEITPPNLHNATGGAAPDKTILDLTINVCVVVERRQRAQI